MSHSHQEDFLKAFDQLSDAIFRYCYFRVFDREVASDLAQTAFMKTWEYLASGKEVKNLKAFVYQVATNLIIDHARSKKSLSLDELRERDGFDVGFDARDQWRDRLDSNLVVEQMRRLDEPQRTALLLRYVEDMNPAEIAQATGETANVVSVRIHRGLSALRKIIKH